MASRPVNYCTRYTDSIIERLLSTPIPATADLFDVAEICSAFVNELMECHDTAQSQALCGRLSHALVLLHRLCNADLPPHRIEQLMASEASPSVFPDYWGDTDTLVSYAHCVTQVLLSGTLADSLTVTMTGLLHDLVHAIEGYIKEPRVVMEQVH
ncbi:hypothetical protein GTGU_04477 [Trabulsiella guamensis ATCC 49490]|uniref:Uncharacterized protein n=1 Tax=Trabulsiella guamensis ATCC 49490 TaxID=1005994 RepID=A0A084ZMW2_9ENTR|nr:hypothetical protein [Trabulsiella guamensis]KFB98806.1 hypothetical protein GTGU_04477 [Trabulsiella guamensis ATCC 49490]